MDTEQLQTLATNARLNHWPPHLGVTTDAEKIEYLAQRLEEAARASIDVDEVRESMADEINELKDKLEDLETDFDNRIESLRDEIEKLESEGDE